RFSPFADCTTQNVSINAYACSESCAKVGQQSGGSGTQQKLRGAEGSGREDHALRIDVSMFKHLSILVETVEKDAVAGARQGGDMANSVQRADLRAQPLRFGDVGNINS